jgi:hypothetical protein
MRTEIEYTDAAFNCAIKALIENYPDCKEDISDTNTQKVALFFFTAGYQAKRMFEKTKAQNTSITSEPPQTENATHGIGGANDAE